MKITKWHTGDYNRIPGHGDCTYYLRICDEDNEEICQVQIGYTEDYDKKALRRADLIADLPLFVGLLLEILDDDPHVVSLDGYWKGRELLRKHGLLEDRR